MNLLDMARPVRDRLRPLWRAFYVLRQGPPQAWPLWKRGIYYLWQVLPLAAASALLGRTLLDLACGPYPMQVLEGYLANGWLTALNLLPVAGLCFLFFAATGSAWSAYLLGGASALALSLGNCYKLQFRDDPLYLEDLFVLREAGAMAGSGYELFLDGRMTAAIAALVLGTILLRLLVWGRLPGWKRRTAALALTLAALAGLAPVYLDGALYRSVDNYQHLNARSPTQDYVAHGFFYPFLHSAGELLQLPPEGYSRSRAENLLAAYQDRDVPADRRVSVIAIMREAYADFSRLEIDGLDTSGYAPYHALEAESYTGDLITNVFAGDTLNTERCFLTGGYTLGNYRRNTNSYAWYLRKQGYTTEGHHPYHQWFYNRQNVNAMLGLERYRFWEGDFETMSEDTYPADALLFSELYQDFQSNKATGKPYFNFSVTVQTHGPYASWDLGNPNLLEGDYSVECAKAVSHYLAAIWDADQALLELVERLRRDPEPVVLVTFGDHMPWMGNGKVFYEEMGVNLDLDTEEGFRNHYTTRYLIWANDAARELLGHGVRGEGPDISPCYLMNLVFRQLGWEGPAFTQAMDDLLDELPVVTANGRYLVDGALTGEVPEARQEEYRRFLYLQHYWSTKFLFGT